MFQLKFWQADNTFLEKNITEDWAYNNQQQRDEKIADAKSRGGNIYRKLWTFWFGPSIRVVIVRRKK